MVALRLLLLWARQLTGQNQAVATALGAEDEALKPQKGSCGVGRTVDLIVIA